jgi:20S proteasome alpha/beta subunit
VGWQTMTAINMLSVKGGGIAVADAQASGSVRKTNTAEKLHLLPGDIIYGGTGPGSDLESLYRDIHANLQGKNTLGDAVDATLTKILGYRIDEKDRILKANMGITHSDLLAGTFTNGRPLSQDAVAAAKQYMHAVDQNTSLQIMLGGIEESGFGIYIISSDGVRVRVSTPNASIGSGTDESHKVLSNYVSQMAREDRNSINPQSGLVKVIEATNASSDINIGVGGSPSIIYISSGKVYIPKENNCILAADLVRGLVKGQLPAKFVKEEVYTLVTNKDVDFRDVNERMFSQAKNPKALDLLLRGFKVQE